MSIPASSALLTDTGWRRLDSRMVLVHPVNEVVRFLPALVGVFLIGNSTEGGGWWHIAAIAVPIALGLLRYLTTRFRITATQLELSKGLFTRNVLTAPLDRVRTVELTSSPIHRILGLARVEIGTGSTGLRGVEKLRLDSLRLPQARALRAELLHHSPLVPTPVSPPTGASELAAPPGPDASATDEVLLRFDPAWVRYAPLTTGGLTIAFAALAATSQFSWQLIVRTADRLQLGDRAATVPLWVAAIGAVITLLVVISVLAVLGYVLTNWGFTLSRDRVGRSYHVARGLLTARETSIDTDRIRGVEIHEPLGLRLTGGGRATAIVTGMSRRESGGAPLVPPAPARVARAMAVEVLGGTAALTTPLVAHGAAARQRRWIRALGVAALFSVGWMVVVGSLGWPLPAYVAAALPLAVGALLAHDRYARLGHALTDRYLVVRASSFHGRRDVLERTGIIGWNIQQSWFQRRAGLVTLTATTAAGRQGYPVPDVPAGEAIRLADAAVPGLLEPFLLRPDPR